jgi:hypothetical protein
LDSLVPDSVDHLPIDRLFRPEGRSQQDEHAGEKRSASSHGVLLICSGTGFVGVEAAVRAVYRTHSNVMSGSDRSRDEPQKGDRI